jgi:trk system potassium uptake protein TrkA
VGLATTVKSRRCGTLWGTTGKGREALEVHIVIMGCGRVGSTLAHGLEARGHSIAVIDQDGDAFRRLGSDFAGITVTGIGYDREVLEAAGIERADAFAAVSSGDNSNIISARLARETFGVARVAARIYDPKRAEVYERLGIPTVATVRWTADRMMRLLVPDGHHEIWRDPTSSVAIVEVPINPGWVSRPVKALEETTGARVAYVMRFGLGTLPTASTLIQDGDQVFFLVTDEMTAGVTKVAGAPPEGGH